MKKKILVFCDGFGSKQSEMAGMKWITRLYQSINHPKIEIHIFSYINSKESEEEIQNILKMCERYSIKFHYKKTANCKASFLVSRWTVLFNILRIAKQIKAELIHEYGSSELLFIRSWLIKKFYSIKTVFSLVTHSRHYSPRFLKFASNSIDIIIKTFVGAPIKRPNEIILPLGIISSPFIEKARVRDIDKSKIKFLYLGRIEKSKGIFTLLTALKDVSMPKDIHITFALMNLDTPFCKFQKAKNEFLQQLPENDMQIDIIEGKIETPDLMSENDVLLLPTDDISGTFSHPSTLLEGLYNGMIVIASKIPGHQELLRDRENALLFKAKDSKSLTEKIDELLNNRNLASKISSNALSTLGKEFDLKSHAENLINIYCK
jgi:glycosyltransferase involved in cell wall biosynthesis